jgi:hypothetical protein
VLERSNAAACGRRTEAVVVVAADSLPSRATSEQPHHPRNIEVVIFHF